MVLKNGTERIRVPCPEHWVCFCKLWVGLFKVLVTLRCDVKVSFTRKVAKPSGRARRATAGQRSQSHNEHGSGMPLRHLLAVQLRWNYLTSLISLSLIRWLLLTFPQDTKQNGMDTLPKRILAVEQMLNPAFKEKKSTFLSVHRHLYYFI